MYKMDKDQFATITYFTVDNLVKLKNGGDALLLYFSYSNQSRKQKTNQSWSLDIFMMKKLGRGKARFGKAKKALKDTGLIDVVQSRDSKGKVLTWYVKINLLLNPEEIRTKNLTYNVTELDFDSTQNHRNPPTGNQETNALSIKNKCFKYKNNIHGKSKTDFATMTFSFGLTKENIESWFGYKKPLVHIEQCCKRIQEISRRFDFLPIYDKDTINATSIMINRGVFDDREGFIKYCEDNDLDKSENYGEMIRINKYLPEEIDKEL